MKYVQMTIDMLNGGQDNSLNGTERNGTELLTKKYKIAFVL